jgi:hypothetical protein
MLRRSPLGILVGLVITVAVVGFGVSKAVKNVGDAKEGTEQASGNSSANADGEDSLVRAANFEKAIDAVRGKTGARSEVLELRLEPGEARFQVRDGDGAKGWTYTSGGHLGDFGVRLIGPGRIEDNVFPIAQLKAGTPERIVAGIHARAPQYDLADVQFMTLDMDPAGGGFVWRVNIGAPGQGRLYLADLDGGNIRSPGDVPAASGGAATTTPGAGVADCIAKAAGDPAEIQACAR